MEPTPARSPLFLALTSAWSVLLRWSFKLWQPCEDSSKTLGVYLRTNERQKGSSTRISRSRGRPRVKCITLQKYF